MYYLMETIGWIGGILILLSYGALTLKKVTETNIAYRLANAVGSLMLVAFTLYKHAYPPAVVNAIWFILAMASFSKKN